MVSLWGIKAWTLLGDCSFIDIIHETQSGVPDEPSHRMQRQLPLQLFPAGLFYKAGPQDY